MRNKKTVLAAIALVVVMVIGSMAAYLTSVTGNVTNTMTVGDVDITLDETKVNEYGEEIPNEDPVTENTYKLLPNHTYVKDPEIHVLEGSEPCYVFVKVTNQIAAIEAAGDTTIAKQMEAKGWLPLEGKEGVFYKADPVDARQAQVDVPVFDSFKIDGAKSNEEIATYAGKTIVIKGYAIQSDGFADAVAASAGLNFD